MPFDGSYSKKCQALLIARDMIERGWCQGRYQDEADNVCLAGAINAAAAKISIWTIPIYLLFDESSLFVWNDAPGRTKEEVLALIDGALERVG